MSWLDELRPIALTARRFAIDVLDAWRVAREHGDSRHRAVAHVGLKLIQTIAYAAGWAAGARVRFTPLMPVDTR